METKNYWVRYQRYYNYNNYLVIIQSVIKKSKLSITGSTRNVGINILKRTLLSWRKREVNVPLCNFVIRHLEFPKLTNPSEVQSDGLRLKPMEENQNWEYKSSSRGSNLVFNDSPILNEIYSGFIVQNPILERDETFTINHYYSFLLS